MQLSLGGALPERPTRTVGNDELLSTLQTLHAAYHRGDFGGVVHEKHPGLDPASREHYLYFTLAPALNFQRKSEGLWRAADATYRDPDTRFVFFPENLGRGRVDYLDALSRYSLATFRDKHTDIWCTVSSTLARDYDSDPRSLLSSADHDVATIKALVRGRRREFPYLSGPKLLNYWLYMLDSFTDIRLTNKSEISIIPDVHVINASVRLGVVPEWTADRDVVADAWYALLAETDFSPIDLHGPLWRWARLGFPTVSPQ